MSSLAIVIPAYKPDFFREALESVVAQSDRRFRVYVGDDCGPPEIAEACASARDIDLVYRRFDENLGQRSLTAQWNRCVRLSSEPWVWLFSDDDLMRHDCVASFYGELDDVGGTQVLRFDTDIIDARGETLRENRPHPRTESGVDFVFSRLQGTRGSYVVEYVFRRAAFDRNAGFADYPAAWCADDVSWFHFSSGGPIRTLRGGKVMWRASGRNVTEDHAMFREEKLAASERFLRFVENEVRPSDAAADDRSPYDWQAAAERWYLSQLRYFMPMGPRMWRKAWRTTREHWHASFVKRAWLFTFWNLRFAVTRLPGRLARLLLERRRP